MALRVRKNQADLSDDEKSRFIAAIKQIKSAGIYDHFIVIHQASMSTPQGHPMNMWAHQRPGFLPWHRQLILDFENALRAADSSLHGGAPSAITLPYWDWVHYRAKKKFWWWGKIWNTDMMGGDGDSGKQDAVTDGPFRAPAPNSDGDWKMFYTPDQLGPPPTQMPNDPNSKAFLQRQLARDTANLSSSELPTQEEWDAAKVITVYDSAPWDNTVGASTSSPAFAGVNSFRNVLEGWVPYNPAKPESELHNKVHLWVGGSMEPISSPNDPIFFLHHCNVDRLWAYWQLRNPKVPYLPDGSTPALTGPEGHNLNDAMHPWDGVARKFVLSGGGTFNLNLPVVKIRDVLNHNALGYRYDSDPPALSPHP